MKARNYAQGTNYVHATSVPVKLTGVACTFRLAWQPVAADVVEHRDRVFRCNVPFRGVFFVTINDCQYELADFADSALPRMPQLDATPDLLCHYTGAAIPRCPLSVYLICAKLVGPATFRARFAYE